jgi:hypothetical protein
MAWTFARRVLGAAVLDGRTYAQSLLAGIIGSLIGWMAWAALTYLIGTHLLPELQTKADVTVS